MQHRLGVAVRLLVDRGGVFADLPGILADTDAAGVGLV
jgi:hypothetical protein